MSNNKQAILITAYKNFEYLYILTKKLKNDFDIYIHIDKKSKVDEEIINRIKSLGCYITKTYSIYWGAYNHLLAIIDLMEAASAKNYSYYHIISGEDIPVKKPSYFRSFFENNNNIYIASNNVQSDMWKNRYKYYYYFVNKDPYSPLVSKLNRVSLSVQKLLKVNRTKLGGLVPYKGYVYGSFPDEAVKYILSFIKQNKKFLKQISMTFIPEEFFFQTILEHSQFKDRITKNCLRYSVWEYKNNSMPGYLDMSDYENIKNGDYIFARKVNKEFSSELIDKLFEAYDKNI